MKGRNDGPLLARLVYFRHVNIPALLAGIITIYLVLQSREFIVLVSQVLDGDYISFGYGDIEIYLFGRRYTPPIIDYLIISSKLSYLVAGSSLIVGYLIRDEQLSRGLIGFKLPSMTGLILVVAIFILSYLGGVFNPFTSEISVSLSLNIGGQIYMVPISYSVRLTLNSYLTIAANVLAIVGRLAVKSWEEPMEDLRICIHQYTFPSSPTIPLNEIPWI